LPGPPVLEIAKRIGFLYLNEEIKVDTIHMDRFYLEQPSKQREIWWYYAGVNYFSAQGDGRWWQDHRMPGGLAYSVNSVAHLVKSGNIARSIEEILKDHRLLLDTGWTKTKIESLPKALEFAMRTISNAADAVSGKATQLLTYDEDQNCDAARCPIELTGKLKGMSYCHYRGYYHTDHTLPSSYFMPDVKRPNDIHTFELDFTYLYDEGLHNPEHFTMGKGMRIRHGRHSLDREHESRFLKGISNLASEAEYYGWVSEIQSRIGKPESSN